MEAKNAKEETAALPIPLHDSALLLQYFHRDINALSSDDSKQKKKSLLKLYDTFVLKNAQLEKKVLMPFLLGIQKPLFVCLFDKSEKTRELTVLISKHLLGKSDDPSLSLPYLIPILVERLNADDIEGTMNVPEIMRPQPSQKPMVMKDYSHDN